MMRATLGETLERLVSEAGAGAGAEAEVEVEVEAGQKKEEPLLLLLAPNLHFSQHQSEKPFEHSLGNGHSR